MPAAPGDGFRILVDRLWPRGMKKDAVAVDLWMKDIAPSPELRTWFGHQEDRFDEFKVRYLRELKNNPELARLKGLLETHAAITLLYAAMDEKHNHAVLLKEMLHT